ncbi:MAG: YfjI family protein [Alphaproteobacteria bacterium]|nr:YfjI family protein [Alphaproteobacteria bacterium]
MNGDDVGATINDAEPLTVPSVPWPDPAPLPAGLKPVLTFDPEWLPPAIRPWVEDIVERLQVPADYIATPVLVALGGVIGNRIRIRPQAKTSWTEACNLWALIIGRPGVMKSPSIEEALAPLKMLEYEANTANAKALRDHAISVESCRIRRDAEVARFKAAIKSALKSGVEPDLKVIAEPEAPVARRFIVTDVSYEKLGEILADNPQGVLAHRDEIAGLLKSLAEERNASARGFYLSAWSGTGSYAFDRISRGHVRIESACLSIVGSTQPGKIASFVRHAINGGDGDDGMLQRFSLVCWPDLPPNWKNVDRYPDTEARREVVAIFRSLAEMTPEDAAAVFDDITGVAFLRFTLEGLRLFEGWRSDLEHRLRSMENPALESHLAKFRKAVPALALIHWLASGGSGAVGAISVDAAIKLAKYLESHAVRLYSSARVVDAEAARLILAKVRRGDLTDGFTARDIKQRDWAGLTHSAVVDSALALLAEYDWTAPMTVQTGGRSKTAFTINPKAMAANCQKTEDFLKTRQRGHPQNPQKSF